MVRKQAEGNLQGIKTDILAAVVHECAPFLQASAQLEHV